MLRPDSKPSEIAKRTVGLNIYFELRQLFQGFRPFCFPQNCLDVMGINMIKEE